MRIYSGSRVRSSDTRRVKPPAKQADPELLTREHRQWAAHIITRAGHRCEAILPDGSRCKVAAPSRLFADHIKERRDGGDPLDPANGQCLCGRHHSLKTASERAKRRSA